MPDGRAVGGSTYDGAPEAGRSATSAALMTGRVCLVTGANRGLGRATALGLARTGATVVVMARDERLGAAARDDIERESGNPAVSVIALDLASLDSVHRAANEVLARFAAVHVLVNNAGVNPARRATSADGVELTFAVNHLGPFLLTTLLLPLLRRGARETGDARVVTVSSDFERLGRADFDDLRAGRRSRAGLFAYTRSKLANVLFTYELAERLAGTGVTANCVYPGLVATDLMRQWALFRPRPLRALWAKVLLTPEQGARAAVYAASAPELAGVTGKCFDRYGREIRTSRASYDVAARERLWRSSERLVNGVAGSG